MEIKDAIGIYQFLGDINLYGALGICGLLSVIFFLGTYAAIKSLPESIIPKRIGYLSLGIPAVVLISILFLRTDAVNRAEKLKLANKVKAYLIANHYQFASLGRIEKGLKCVKRNGLKELPALYPDEFLLIFDVVDSSGDTVGIKLVDPVMLKQLEEFDKKLSVVLRCQLKNYMCRNCLLTYKEVLEWDHRYTEATIDQVISSFPEEFAADTSKTHIVRL